MQFETRLRMYLPGATTGTTFPASTAECRIVRSEESITISVSRLVFNSLPEIFEVALEYFNTSTLLWVEPRNARWLVTNGTEDDVDPANIVQLQGIGLWRYMAGKAVLADSDEFNATGMSATGALTLTGINKTGSTTFILTGHGLTVGDQVKVTDRGRNRTLKRWSTYYVVAVPTSAQFRLSSSRSGSPIKHGGVTGGLALRRVVDTITATAHPFTRDRKIQFSAVGASKLTVGRTYVVVRPTTNSFQLALQAGGRPIEIGAATGLAATTIVDGKRQFKNLTPGAMVRLAIVEAQARGWGSFLSRDFTTTLDSAGATWPATQTWPIALGSKTTEIIDLIASVGLARFGTQGRTLQMFLPAPTTPGTNLVRLGRAASSRPVSYSIDDLATHATIVGRGKVRAIVASGGAPTALGRLEMFEAGDSSTNAWAASRGAKAIAAGADVAREYTATYSPEMPQVPLPFVDFDLDDWVQIKNKTGGWITVQVRELQLRIAEDGSTEVDVIAGTRRASYLARLARGQALRDLRQTVSRAASDARKAKAAAARKKKK